MRRLFLLILATFSAVITISAQSVRINGRVQDENGEPIMAVAVYEKNNPSAGTITDSKGNYILTISSPKTEVIFTCLGYKEQKVQTDSKLIINVILESDSIALEDAEVVAVGYGSVARRDLTGSVSKVGMEDILKSHVTNFDEALAGRVAGVIVSTPDGELGGEANIVIRGNNSLTQDNSPLYVIDGFPSENSMAASIDPEDIESIDILKDASATAIYGARGANGVIVINTKKGTEGKAKVSFSASLSVNNITKKMDLMDPYEFVALQDELYQSTGNPEKNPYLIPSDEDKALGALLYPIDVYKGEKALDWQDAILRTALTQKYNVSVSGGNKKLGNTYNVTLSTQDQDGIILNSDYQKYRAKISLTQKFGKNVTADFIASYSRSVKNGTSPTSSDNTSQASTFLMYSVWSYMPTVAIGKMHVDDDIDLEDGLEDTDLSSSYSYRYNPLKTVKNEYRKNITDNLSANASLTWQIIKGLNLKISGGYNSDRRTNEVFNGTNTRSGDPRSTSGDGVNGSITWREKMSWLNENTLTWEKRFRHHHKLDLLAGFTMQGEDQRTHGVKAKRLTTEELGLAGLHTGVQLPVTPVYYESMLMSGLFRVNYNYKYKYYVTASFRADGSSKFPIANRWGYFPSIGLSWNFNKEPWFENASWLSRGKLRVSWGQTGNNRTNTPYDYYSQVTTTPGSSGSFDYVINGTWAPGYYVSKIANEHLKWETTEQWNVGTDLSFLESRIKVTADWYLKDTYDLLLNATIPSSSGFKNAMLNVGSMRNQGVELTMDFVPVKTRNLLWNLNFNVAWNRNTVTSLTDNEYSIFRSVSWHTTYNAQYAYISQVGKPTGMMYGYVYEGTYKPNEFENGVYLKDGIPYNVSIGRDSVAPGDPKYRDINEDGYIDENDQTIIGYGQPICTGGFGTSLNAFGFDLNVFFSWSYGNDILNANRLMFESCSGKNENKFRSYVDRWTPENPTSDIPRVYANGTDVYSSRVIEDGSYLKLRNISLGYTLPSRLLKKMHFSQFRVYVSANNILTFTNYSGYDPEVSTKHSVLTPGFDWSAYPRSLGMTAGLQFTF